MFKKILSFIILIIVALVFYIVANYMDKVTPEKEDLLKTTGIITNIVTEYDSFDEDEEHEVFVKYEIEGKEYETKLNSYYSSYYVGKEIDLYYDETDPYKMYTGDEGIMINIFRIAGIIGMIGGAIGIGYVIVKEKNAI